MSNFVVERRHYEIYFVKDHGGVHRNDYYLYLHKNGLAVIGLSPYHYIFEQPVTDLSVSFVCNGIDCSSLLNLQLKRIKKLKTKIKSTHGVCTLEWSGPNSERMQLKVPALVSGGLIELNNNLIEHPQLLFENPSKDGYIAIMKLSTDARVQDDTNYVGIDEYLGERSCS